MEGQFRKKEEQKLFEEKKKQLPIAQSILATEGPMRLRDERQNTEQHEKERRISVGTAIGVQLINESRQIEEMGRSNFEKSVRAELDDIKKRLLGRKKKAPAPKARKKPRYGWKTEGGTPPGLPDDGEAGGEGGEESGEDSGESENSADEIGDDAGEDERQEEKGKKA